MADERVATFGSSANALDPATMKRIKQVLENNKTLRLTAANCADFAIKMASSWMKDSTERTLDSAQRGWKTFCHIFEFPPLIDGLDVGERESIAVAYVGYMVQTIKAARGDQPAAGTLQNYITAVRRLHDRHGVRFDVFSTAEMPILAFVLKKVCQHLKAHAPLAAAKPLVPLKLFLRMVAMWNLSTPGQALIAAIVRFATFTGRRMGDFLPQRSAAFRAFSDLTFKHVIFKKDRIEFTLMDTKNRIGGPPWYGCLTRNTHDPRICPVRALEAYLQTLKTHHGDVSDTAPFFQTFDHNTNKFTGLAYSVDTLSRVIHSTLTKLGAKQNGQCIHFRVEVANMLYEAGVDKMYHNRFMDWKDPDYDRRHRQAGTYMRCMDPMLPEIQEIIYKHFAIYSSTS
jgi:hypothetical protein